MLRIYWTRSEHCRLNREPKVSIVIKNLELFPMQLPSDEIWRKQCKFPDASFLKAIIIQNIKINIKVGEIIPLCHIDFLLPALYCISASRLQPIWILKNIWEFQSQPVALKYHHMHHYKMAVIMCSYRPRVAIKSFWTSNSHCMR